MKLKPVHEPVAPGELDLEPMGRWWTNSEAELIAGTTDEGTPYFWHVPPESFLILEGGTLDVGIIRDRVAAEAAGEFPGRWRRAWYRLRELLGLDL